MWLPIVQRELRLASRRPALYLVRPVAPLVLLLFTVGPFLVYSVFRGQEGRACFNALGAGIFTIAIFAGLAFSADCISIERRQGTLPLLQLAGLTNLDILLGKLAGTGIPALLALLSILPLLSIPLLLGGVQGIEVVKLVFVLFSTLSLALAAGLWGSTRSTHQSDSLKKSVLLLLGLLLGGVALAGGLLLSTKSRRRKLSSFLFGFAAIALLMSAPFFVGFFGYLPGSPLYDLIHISARPLGGTPAAAFWLSLVMTFSAALAVTTNTVAIALSPTEPPQSTTVGKPKSFSRHLRYFSDPLKWLILRETDSRAALGWAVAAVLCVRLFYISPSFFNILRWNPWILVSLPSIAMTFLLARLCASFIARGHETGTLEILLTTPVTWWEIIRVQKRIYLETALLPAAALFTLELLSYTRNSGFGRPDSMAATLYLASSLLSTVFFFFSIFWMSLYFSLKSNSALHAAGKATFWITLLPTLGSYLAPLLFRGFSSFGLAPYAIMTFFFKSFHIAIYLAMILWAKKRIVPPDHALPQRPKRSISWVQLPWERVHKIGEDVL